MTYVRRYLALFVALAVVASLVVLPAAAGVTDVLSYPVDSILDWFNINNDSNFTGGGRFDDSSFTGGGRYQSNKPQHYYTTPTQSVEDQYGNVVNYYRGGDTTNTKIIDSYNRTFNTIHNTTNNTSNYSANVKLNDFLNQYTTNNNDYTFSADLKSWYYDYDTNNYNYTTNNTYYNTDNSRYYVSIDNSTDEYYLVDIQYSPTFVTVNYEYNTTNNTTTNYGDVTNIYYYELDDGRNSYTLTVNEALGIATGYDVVNYDLVVEDVNTLSLQHFDKSYSDVSAYGRQFYSELRSTDYVDSGDFGYALKLPSGSAAGATILDLNTFGSLQIDFRVYYDDISSLQVNIGDTVIFGSIPSYKKQVGNYVVRRYSDNGQSCSWTSDYQPSYSLISANLLTSISPAWSTTYTDDSYALTVVNSGKYGYYVDKYSEPVISINSGGYSLSVDDYDYSNGVYSGTGTKNHYDTFTVKSSFTGESVPVSFSFGSYTHKWVSMRIVISGGKIYYFVNGDLAGSGSFTIPTADKVYIKSNGTVYLDELRVSTGDLVSSSAYTPSDAPFDTNQVLALPDTLTVNTIYVRSEIPVNGWRIGGVRPSAPATGFFYIPLHSDYTGGQPQIYDGSNWLDVDSVISPDGVTVVSVVGYLFTPAGAASDVNPDLQPGRPDSGSNDPATCAHSWLITDTVNATCAVDGQNKYECSKCHLTKSEIISALGHSWTVSGTVQTVFDENGNVVTQGYTLYKCSVCNTEYKDLDGSGPPSSGKDSGFWGKVGSFFGTTLSGLIKAIESILTSVFDGLISLVTAALDRITSIVDLFGDFGKSIGELWSWLPPEVMNVLISAVTVLVFVAVIKVFL